MSVRFFYRLNFKIALLSILIIFFISASGAAGLAQTITETEKAARAFKFAKGLFDMEKYKQAASELQKFIAFYEKSPYGEYALYLLGESLYKTENYKDALDKYELFQKKYKDSKLIEEAYYSSAYTLLALDKPEEAHSYFLKLYNSQNPDLSRDAVYKCARHLIDKKQNAEARKAFADYFKLTGFSAEDLDDAEKLGSVAGRAFDAHKHDLAHDGLIPGKQAHVDDVGQFEHLPLKLLRGLLVAFHDKRDDRDVGVLRHTDGDGINVESPSRKKARDVAHDAGSVANVDGQDMLHGCFIETR